MLIVFPNRPTLAFARTFLLSLALATGMTAAMSAPSLMTLNAAGKNARSQFDIKSAATPVQLNRAAMAKLRTLDELEFILPNGISHLIVFDRIEDHGGDIRSSVGYLKNFGKDFRVILTTGPSGTFGSIRTPETIYRIVPGQDGQDLLVDMTEEQKHIPFIDLGDDARRAPDEPTPSLKDKGLQASAMRASAQPVEQAIALATPTPQATIDLMIVYTTGLANKLGAGLLTRLNNLVTAANTAYIDSEVAITLRLVNTTQVNYTDAPGDGAALDAITPGRIQFDPFFANIETIRNANGADMVSFLRTGADFGGSGIAWITTTTTPRANFMYSVVTGCTAGCDSVFIHELGHNMGNAHDRATAAAQEGGTPTPQSGANPYAFGHYFCANGTLTCNPFVIGGCGVSPNITLPRCAVSSPNDIGTIMSYFNPVKLKFSNPALNCALPNAAAQPCGVANSEDNARSMNDMRLALQAIKASVGAISSTALSSSLNPSITGQSVTFTATVTGSVGVPTGSVIFRDGASVITNCSLVAVTASGVAQCVTAGFTQGGHSITALYQGNSVYNTSTSAALIQTVNPITFLLSVTRAGGGNGQISSSPAGIDTAIGANSANFNAGQSVTLTASPQIGSSFAGWTGGGCGVSSNCVITMNAITSVTATFNVVQTVPTSPTIGTATPGNAQALIAFTPPASDGGSPITGYTATCNPGAIRTPSAASPVNVVNLVNGTAYTCSVTANNTLGSSAASGTVAVTPTLGAALALASVVSRKTHTGVGNFDIVIGTAPPITGPVSVEPRAIGSGHSVLFKFNNTITNAGTVSVVDGLGASVNATAATFGTDAVLVTIAALADNKRITISLNGVNTNLNTSASMGFLIGDFNNTRSVNASDINGVKAHNGQATNLSNFKFDVNASGAISASDISAVKARSGLVLP